MYIQVGNITSKVIIGGKDNLLGIDIDKELSKYFEVPYPKKNQRFMEFKGEAVKKYYKYKSIPTGLLPYLYSWCQSKGLEVEFEDLRTNMPRFRGEFRNVYGKKELFPHQEKLVRSVNTNVGGLFFPRGIWDAATNAGKTLSSLALVDNLEGARALFIVPSQELFANAVGEFSPFLHVGEIRPKKFTLGKDITVAMVKTLLYMMRNDSELVSSIKKTFNVVIVDECHRSSGGEYKELLAMIDAPVRILISGTPLVGDNIKKMDIISMCGPPLQRVTNKDMIDAGISTPVEVFIHECTEKPKNTTFTYEDFKEDCLFSSIVRVNKIIDICKDRTDKQILIPFFQKSHGYFMLEHLQRSIKGAVVDIVHGTDFGRAYKIEQFKKCDINILLCSTILKEGVNIPNIEVLINAIGGESVTTLLQFLGRGLRKNSGKEKLEYHDFYDNSDYLDKHSRTRINILKQQGLPITFTYDYHAQFYRPKTKFKK